MSTALIATIIGIIFFAALFTYLFIVIKRWKRNRKNMN